MTDTSDLDRLTAIIKQNSIPPVSHRTMAAKIIASGWVYCADRDERITRALLYRIRSWIGRL